MTVPGQWARLRNQRNELAALLVLALAGPLLPFLRPGSDPAVPAGVLALGLVAGASLGMQAMGVVLVYRTHRFINFGQVYFGSVAATAFSLSVRYRPLYRWVGSICPPCAAEDVGRGAYLVNYWLSLFLALGMSLGIAWLAYVVVFRRLEGAPRLVAMVASLFMGPAAGAIAAFLRNALTTVEQREDGLEVIGQAPLPFDVVLRISPVQLHATELLMVALAIASGTALFAFLRFSAVGTALRASSENPNRAETLGISVRSVNTLVWLIVGVLSAIPSLLDAMSVSGGAQQGVTIAIALRILLVCVIARFVSLPLAVAGALALGVLQQSTLWVFDGSTVPLDGAMVLLVAGLLLLQSRQQASRAEIEAAGVWQATAETRPTPPELRALPSVRSWARTGAIVGGLLVLGLPWALSAAQTSLASVTMIYGIVTLSILILTGWAGQVSLGQFGFAAVGGYVAALVHVPFLFAVLIGGAAGAVVACLLGIPALRLRGMHLAISTLAFSVSVTAILINPRYLGKHLPRTVPRPALLGLDLQDERTFYYVSLVFLALSCAGVLGLRRSRTGRALIATRDNEQAAQAFGLSLVRIRLTGFTVSGFYAAVAGSLYAFQQNGVKVDAFSEAQSFAMFNAAVIGGLGSVAGPVIGAVYTGLLLIFGANELVATFFTGFGGLALILLVPGGLGSLVFSGRDALLRRVAKRNRIVVASLTADGHPGAGSEQGGVLAPKPRSGAGGFVPRRYALDEQWALPVPTERDERLETGEFQGLADADDMPSHAEAARA